MNAKNVQGIICLVLFFIFTHQAWAADWKYFGGSVVSKGETIINFYDADSIEYSYNGNVIVWTKTVIPAEIEKKAREKEVIQKAANKVIKGYTTPYFKFIPYERDTYVEITAWEEAVNHYKINAKTNILFEIDCADKKIRMLSGVSYKNNGEIESNSKNNDWNNISPESNGETLKNILCSAGKTSKATRKFGY